MEENNMKNDSTKVVNMINNYNLQDSKLKINADTDSIFDIEHINTYINNKFIYWIKSKVIYDWIIKKSMTIEDAVRELVNITLKEYHTYFECRAD